MYIFLLYSYSVCGSFLLRTLSNKNKDKIVATTTNVNGEIVIFVKIELKILETVSIYGFTYRFIKLRFESRLRICSP